jgi:drug/metabolite transporter (DMT)-like permease
LADVSLVNPVDFLRLPLIAVVGFLAYGEGVDVLVLVGAGIIFVGNYYSIRRENR